MPLPFEQQPKESVKAFGAFSLYLGMGPERSTQAVAKELAKSEQLVRRWSARWKWTERVQAHGAYLAAVEREAVGVVARGKAVEWARRQQALLEEEWSVHEECIRAGREALKRFYERGKGATLGDIARMFAEGSRLGRLASGLATDRTEVTGEDGGPIRVELEAALKKVYGDIVDVVAAALPVGEGNAPPERRAKSLPGTDEGK
jgi:hypothetical protein